VRVDLRWRSVEPLIKGVDDWGEFDAIHNGAQAHGITLLPIVAMPPDWANGGRGVWAYPDNPKDFEDFMVTALKRYPDIPAWEIWNEPNLPAFSEPNVDVGKFVELLAAAHNAKERAGSSTQIVSGGLSSGGVDVMQYFEDMIRLHAFDYVDGFGIHPYSFVAPDSPEAFYLRVPKFHDRLVQIGRPNVGIWITEYGAPTSTHFNEYGPPIGDAEQAARLNSAFAVASRWPWVKNLTWYEFQDLCEDPTNFMCNFGVVREDMSPKPAATALKSIAAGKVPKIDSEIDLGRVRNVARLGRRYLKPPLPISGTLDTPGAQGAPYTVKLTMSWAPRRGAQAARTRTFMVNASGGQFSTTMTRMRPGYWRIVASYPGSADYTASSSSPEGVVVKRPRRR
jgi:polysaccharide biosynthesis protein PslG